MYSSFNQNKKVDFICTSCGFKEKIPKNVVDAMDMDDFKGDLRYPPRFSCDSCPTGTMYPLHYRGFSKITYTYNPKTKQFSPKLPL
jgi:hypothetical protein